MANITPGVPLNLEIRFAWPLVSPGITACPSCLCKKKESGEIASVIHLKTSAIWGWIHKEKPTVTIIPVLSQNTAPEPLKNRRRSNGIFSWYCWVPLGPIQSQCRLQLASFIFTRKTRQLNIVTVHYGKSPFLIGRPSINGLFNK